MIAEQNSLAVGASTQSLPARMIGGLGRLILASIWAIAASAQTAQSPGAIGPALQEVVVTGSRIAAPNEVSTSPIQVVSAKDIRASGKTDISDIINLLPQNFVNSLGQDLGNGTSGLTTAGGVATADLRGLGPNRTLVLVDGRRLGQGSPYTFIQQPAPDLDQIPPGLVERVEVVTGGASAAYGSDAIAGVINFIMKKNFQGFEVDAQMGENWHDNDDRYVQGLVTQFGVTPPTGSTQDGRNRAFNVLMGTDFAEGNGNVTAFMSYRHADPVASSARDFGSCQLNPTTDAVGNVTGIACGGSSNSNQFQPEAGPNKGTLYSVHGTSFVPFGSVPTTPPAEFNSQPYIYMTREDDRFNAAFLAHDAISSAFQPYTEFYFMNDRTHQQVAPAALFKDANPLDPLNNYAVNCSNPLLSAQEQAILCTPAQIAADAANPGSVTAPMRIGRRNVEGGGRTSDYEHTNYRAVFGIKGDFASAWNYDLYGQYYYTTFFNTNDKYLNFQGINNSLLVTGTAANPVCISGPPCVPYNPFRDGGVAPAAVDYLSLFGTGYGNSTLRTLHAEVTGQLGQYGITSPLASNGVAVNIGLEHRNDHEAFQPDSAEQSGLLSGFGSAAVAINNSVSVDEEFMEVRAPLVQDRPGAKELLFDTGFRHSNYSTAGGTTTYKFEVQYAPIDDYRLRASYNTAIRAPSVVELFNPQLVALFPFANDPCAPTVNSGGVLTPATATLAQCINTGVTAAQYGNGGTTNTVPQGTAGQLAQLTGGNPHLAPEKADTYTVGLNFAPKQIPHFAGSIDYYHIKISDEVSTISGQIIMSKCLTTGDPTYCSQIVRASSGSLTGATIAQGGYIVQTNVNIGAALASGVDLQLNYDHDLPAHLGSIGFALSGTYVLHLESTPLPGAHTYDCAGLFGATCQTITPSWHHMLHISWNTPWNVTGVLTWRYIGPTSQDNNTNDPTLHFATFGAYDYYSPKLPSYNYIDLSASWNVSKNVELRAGANNILDKDPPIVVNTIVPGGQANTYDYYDLFGRQLYIALTARF